MQPVFDDAPITRLYAPAPVTPDFDRLEDPPENIDLRILVEDARGEYAIPFPYQYRAGPDGAKDFFSRKGVALDESLAVRGWAMWTREVA